jgi:hypothetical protein
MKKRFLLLSTLVLSSQLIAQITINSSDLASADDTVLVGISTQTTLDYTTTGANQVWDFSNLTRNSERIDTFYNVSSASALYQLSFNNFLTPNYKADYYNKLLNNNLPSVPGGTVTLDKPVFFTKNSSSKSEIVGMGVEVNGVEVPVKADTVDIIYQYPMNYNDNWTSRSYLYMDMNPTFNAIFIRHQLRQSTVDGWGTITTPFGTFDALRVKSTITYTDSVYIDLGFGAQWLPVPTPQDIEYTWWTNGNKIPLLKVVERNGSPATIEFRGVTDYASINKQDNTTLFEIYPNPTNNVLNVNLNNYKNAQIQVIDITGKILFTTNTTQTVNSVDVSELTKGVYFIKITSNNQTTTKQFVKN